jgi:hypothetical protein
VRLLAKLSWIEAKLFLREPLALVFTFAFPFFMLIVLAGVFGNDVKAETPGSCACGGASDRRTTTRQPTSRW